MGIDIPPFVIFFAGALLALMVRRTLLSTMCVLVPLIRAVFLIFSNSPEARIETSVIGLQLILFNPD